VTMGPAGHGIGPTATMVVPAELRFLEVLRLAVRVATENSGCDDGCDRDLQLAVDELASILIVSARTPSGLELAVTHDEADVYVRMVVPVSDAGFHPEVADLTRLLLDATVDSYDVRTDDEDLVGVLQRSLDSDGRG
jgi:anti-sigma regulatory factor (Ser/Thr protein kinase)